MSADSADHCPPTDGKLGELEDRSLAVSSVAAAQTGFDTLAILSPILAAAVAETVAQQVDYAGLADRFDRPPTCPEAVADQHRHVTMPQLRNSVNACGPADPIRSPVPASTPFGSQTGELVPVDSPSMSTYAQQKCCRQVTEVTCLHMSDLLGRSALVSGASRGIGKAVAAELLRRGANVVITARKPEPLEEAAGELRALGHQGEVVTVAGNSGDAESRAAAVGRAVSEFGSLDILINNTGINPVYGSLMDADLDAVRKIFDVNVVAALGYIQEAYKAWMRDNGGAIVNVASVAGIRSTGLIAAYGASKAALIRLTDELAWQLGPNIRVNAVAPGVVKTKFAGALYEAGEEQAASVYPMKRLGAPEDVAKLIGFLVSDEAAWITGETVRVDGGLLSTGGI